MAKYSKGAGQEVKEAMHEMKEGKLRTGTGKKVTSPKQAIAIGLSEAREEGKKVPAKKSGSKTAAKSKSGGSAAKKSASKKGLASANKSTRTAVASKEGKSSGSGK